MATDDVQRLVTGTAPAPAQFTVPGNGQIRPKSIFATFDGTGAAGAFTPALEIISDGGQTVGIYPTSSAVAAGGSADVSWFPSVSGGVTTILSSPGLMWASVQINGAQNITDSANGNVVTWNSAIFDSGTPTPFWSNAHPTRMTAPVNGFYLSLGNLEFDVTNVLTNMGCYVYKNGATGLNFEYEFNQISVANADGVGSYTLHGGTHGVLTLNAGDYLELLAYVRPTAGVAFPFQLIDLRPAQNHYSKWSLVCLATF